MALTSLISSIDKVSGGGKLEKACIIIYKSTGNQYSIDAKTNVQFNPSEYSIKRGVMLSKKKVLGRDVSPKDVQAVSGEPSSLSVSLYFDSYTELLSQQGIVNSLLAGDKSHPSSDMNESTSPKVNVKVNELCDTFLNLIKYAHEEHTPPQVAFVWGEYLHFVGKVKASSVQYTVFDRSGMPVRAKVDITIIGEDISFVLSRNEYPMESPDRTKQRTLHYGDQLWMMAQEEYGDAAYWKTIAAANQILNARKTGQVMRLKVPSIR